MAIGVSHSSIVRPIESRLAAPQEPGRGLQTPRSTVSSVHWSLRPSDQKPRHPVTCSTCAGEYAGSSRVDTARAGLSTKTWSAGMLTCSRSCGIQKRMVLFFWEARGFRFLGILRQQPKVYSSTSLSTPGASHASSPPQKVGFEGHYCMDGFIEGKVVGHHLKLCAVISVSQPLRYGKSNIEPWLCMSRRLAMNMASMRSLLIRMADRLDDLEVNRRSLHAGYSVVG